MFLALIEPPFIMTHSPMFNPLWKARFRKKIAEAIYFYDPAIIRSSEERPEF